VETTQSSPVQIGFTIAWAALAIAGVGFFQQGSNARLKRRFYPLYISLSWVAVATYPYYSSRGWVASLLTLLVITPLCIVAIRATRFCEVCGAPARRKVAIN